MNAHLTNEQFSEIVLAGAPDAASQLHLAECALCSAEMEKFAASVDLFSTVALEWSETRPQPAARPARRAMPARWAVAPLGWALAAAVVISVGVPAWRAEHRAPVAGAVAADAAVDSPADIAQDNALLEQVNVALNTNEDSPLPEYRLAQRDVRAR